MISRATVLSRLLLSLVASGIALAPVTSAAASEPERFTDLPAWGTEPVPQAGSGRSELRGVSSISPADAWAVGFAGYDGDPDATPLVEHWDGSGWSVMATPDVSGAALFGVTAIAADDVWMVGTYNSTRESLILHWDGTTITDVEHPNPGANRNDLYAVAAVGPDDVWAVGDKTSGVSDPLSLHWDGATWREVATPSTASYDVLQGVTAIAANDVWAVGSENYAAAAMHWDGKKWSDVKVGGAVGRSRLNAVSAATSSEVWAVGQDSEGTLTERWNGTAWKRVQSPAQGGTLLPELFGVTVVKPADVWAVGVKYVAGNASAVSLHWDGKHWSTVDTPNPPESTHQLAAADVDPAGRVWAVGSLERQAYALSRVRDKWQVSSVEQVGTASNQLLGLSAVASDDIWAVGVVGGLDPTALTLHYDGASWTQVAAPSPPEGAQLSDVVAIGAADVWAVGQTNPNEFGDGLALHWNGDVWTSVEVPQPGGGLDDDLHAIDAVAPDDIWAVGTYDISSPKTTILHWNGARWSRASTSLCNPYGGLSGLTMLSATDGWAVGNASICHWDGKKWQLVESPQPRPTYHEVNYDLVDASGAAPNDVWAVGTVVYDFEQYVAFGSFTEHWNGTAWARVPNPSGVKISGVEAIASDNVWAVGRSDYGPIIVRWNGGRWTDVPTPGRDNGGELADLTVADDLWAAGSSLEDDGSRSLVERAPSQSQGAVVGTSNVGHASLVWTGPESGSLETDPTGAFDIGGLEAGRYRFTLALEGCVPASKKVVIVAGRTRATHLMLDCS